MNKIQILLVIKHPAYRDALTIELNRRNFICHHADSSEIALFKYERYKPDIVLIEYSLKTLNGPKLIQQLIKLHKNVTAIGKSGGYAEYINRDFQDAGAVGYVWDDLPTEKLLSTIEDIANGHIIFPS